MEKAQDMLLLKSSLSLQLQLAEEEKRKIVEDYKQKNYDSFKEKFLAVNNHISSITDQLNSLGK